MFKKRQTFSVSTPNHISKLKDLSLLVLKFYQFNENAEHRWNHGQVTVKAGVLTSVHIVGKGKPICFKKDCKTKRSYCKVPPCRMVPLKREYLPLFHCVLRNGVEEYSLNDSHVGELVLCLSHFNMEEVQHFYAHKELPLGALPGAESTVWSGRVSPHKRFKEGDIASLVTPLTPPIGCLITDKSRCLI